ncbi:hypothetical protein L9F63_007456, partial [Diploptera punctata]
TNKLYIFQNVPYSSYELEDHNFLDVNIKVLNILGLWNYHWKNKQSWRYIAYFSYSSIASIFLVLHTFCMIMGLILNPEFSDFAEVAWVANNFFATTVKYIFIFVQMDQVQENIMKLRGGVLTKGLRWCQEQDNILRKINKQVKTLSIIYFSIGASAVVMMHAAVGSSYYKLYMELSGAQNYTGQDEKLALIGKVWLPVDLQDPKTYLFIFVFQTIIYTIGPGANIATDALIAGLLIHMCGEFHVLKYALRNLKRRALQLLQQDRIVKHGNPDLKLLQLKMENYSDGSNIKYVMHTEADLDAKIYEAFVEGIKHHQEILKFVIQMEEQFSAMMFVQFLSISLRLCLTIFSITVAEDEVKFMVYLQMLIISFMQGLLYCWFGSELTYQSEDISRVMYETPWLQGSRKFRSSVVIVTMRAQKLVQLTGGKIYTMSLDTFSAMVYGSFSFFKVLQEFSTSD